MYTIRDGIYGTRLQLKESFIKFLHVRDQRGLKKKKTHPGAVVLEWYI